jgi:hypothetical protein
MCDSGITIAQSTLTGGSGETSDTKWMVKVTASFMIIAS